jgi:acidic leucine-rich nuclear phosphoprotein 32 family protein B
MQHADEAGTHLAPLCSFPSLPALRRLRLSDNRIPGGLEHLVSAAPSALELLDLSNNKIASVDALRPLASLSSLAALDLGGCPVASAAGGEAEAAYRAAVFALLPQLTWLDKRNRDGAEGCVQAVRRVRAQTRCFRVWRVRLQCLLC